MHREKCKCGVKCKHGAKCEHRVKCEHEHEAKYECKREARAQSEMCKMGCILFVPFYLYLQVIQVQRLW